jgi:hypothetical protein
VTTATIAHRLGTLRMFVRIEEWGWEEAPPKVPMFPGELPRQDHPLPKALDDASAAKLLRAAQADRRMLVRVTVEMLRPPGPARPRVRVPRVRPGRGKSRAPLWAGLPPRHGERDRPR